MAASNGTYSGKDFTDWVSAASPGTQLNKTNLDNNGDAIDEIMGVLGNKTSLLAGASEITTRIGLTQIQAIDANGVTIRNDGTNNVAIFDDTGNVKIVNNLMIGSSDTPAQELHIKSATPYSIFEQTSSDDVRMEFTLGNGSAQTWGFGLDYADGAENYPFCWAYNASGNTSLTGNKLMRLSTGGILQVPNVYTHDVNGEGEIQLWINNTGELGYDSSTKRKKAEIKDMESADWIFNLRPVNFRYLKTLSPIAVADEPHGPKQWGLVAEEVDQIAPDFVFHDEFGRVEGIHYNKFIPVLIKAVQGLNDRIKILEAA